MPNMASTRIRKEQQRRAAKEQPQPSADEQNAAAIAAAQGNVPQPQIDGNVVQHPGNGNPPAA